MANEKKSTALQEPFGTACHKLRRRMMFHLACKCQMNFCFRCGQIIDNENDLTLDHIKDWLNSSNPKELFYDVHNVKFSHNNCNSLASKRNHNQSKTGRFRGVSLPINGRAKPYKVLLNVNGKRKSVGWFTTDLEAAKAYDKAAIEIYGNQAVTNQSLGLLPILPVT